MRTNQLSWAARLLVVVLVLAACGGGNDTRHPAERVVAGYYIGMARRQVGGHGVKSDVAAVGRQGRWSAEGSGSSAPNAGRRLALKFG